MQRESVIVTIPNLITIIRLVSVPVIIWLVIDGVYVPAFWLFALAGAADALDGYVARRFHLTSELGGYLDPLADKVLLVSLFVVLAIIGVIPVWLSILVLSRDILIVGAVILSWMLEKPPEMRPLVVSKINTLAQILLVAVVLADIAFFQVFEGLRFALIILVAALTTASAGAYLIGWFRHMNPA